MLVNRLMIAYAKHFRWRVRSCAYIYASTCCELDVVYKLIQAQTSNVLNPFWNRIPFVRLPPLFAVDR